MPGQFGEISYSSNRQLEKTKTAKHQSAVRNICYPLATGRFGNTLHYCTIGTFSVALTNVFIKTNRIKFEPDPTLGKVA